MKKLVFAALLLAACDLTGPGGVEVRVLGNQDFVVFRQTDPVTVRYSVTNTDVLPVGISYCGPLVQKKTDGLWNTLTPSGVTCMPGPLLMIAPGGSVTDSVTVQGPGTWRLLVYWDGAPGRSGTAESRAFDTGIPSD